MSIYQLISCFDSAQNCYSCHHMHHQAYNDSLYHLGMLLLWRAHMDLQQTTQSAADYMLDLPISSVSPILNAE